MDYERSQLSSLAIRAMVVLVKEIFRESFKTRIGDTMHLANNCHFPIAFTAAKMPSPLPKVTKTNSAF